MENTQVISEMETLLIRIVEPGEDTSLTLSAALKRLDAILDERGDDIPAPLHHFLKNRSYEKALAWMQGNRG